VTRHDQQRLEDIQAAISAIAAHRRRGTLSEGLVFDAVRVRLIEVGEAVKGLSEELLASEGSIPWVEVSGVRDRLAHRYFDTSHALAQTTVDHDLPELKDAVDRMAARARGD
jgi:uncharacterized protein with HEPN domain